MTIFITMDQYLKVGCSWHFSSHQRSKSVSLSSSIISLSYAFFKSLWRAQTVTWRALLVFVMLLATNMDSAVPDQATPDSSIAEVEPLFLGSGLSSSGRPFLCVIHLTGKRNPHIQLARSIAFVLSRQKGAKYDNGWLFWWNKTNLSKDLWPYWHQIKFDLTNMNCTCQNIQFDTKHDMFWTYFSISICFAYKKNYFDLDLWP